MKCLSDVARAEGNKTFQLPAQRKGTLLPSTPAASNRNSNYGWAMCVFMSQRLWAAMAVAHTTASLLLQREWQLPSHPAGTEGPFCAQRQSCSTGKPMTWTSSPNSVWLKELRYLLVFLNTDRILSRDREEGRPEYTFEIEFHHGIFLIVIHSLAVFYLYYSSLELQVLQRSQVWTLKILSC